jgi:ATP/maltotriose-dependent transcriptional regulator MalT/DNA-binding SARP family transcriptional activator
MAAAAPRLIGKRVPPPSGGIIPRPRLFRRLDVRQPLVWVSGPPGCGKTALVASYLTARRVRSVWYRLDAGDGDVVAFLQDLSRNGRSSLPRQPLNRTDVPAVLARPIFRALYDHLPRSFVLVLDSYDELPEDAPVHEAVREAVMQLPPGGRIIVTSRASPPPSFARLRASQAVAEVGWDDLRLTARETQQLAREAAGVRSRDVVAALYARTEGWAAGLVLSLHDRRPLRQERRGASEAVSDYLATEVLARVDADTRDTLLRIAFLPQVTTAMAEALTGRPGAGQALVELHRLRCFVVERPGPETVYEFTSAFRSFLRRRAHVAFSPEQRLALERTAAGLLARDGRVEAAGALLHAARDWDDLAALVEAHGASLEARGQLHMLAGWLGAMPDEFVAARPRLLLWRGKSRLPRNPAGSRDDFGAALGPLCEADDTTGALLAWAGAVETFVLENDDYGGLDTWIARSEDLLRRFPAFPSSEIEAQVVAAMLAALLYRRPHLASLTVWAQRAVELGRTTTDPAVRWQLVRRLLEYRLWTGELEAAHALAAELRGSAAAPETPEMDRLAAALVIGRLEWLAGDFPSARSTLEAALGLARASGLSLFTHRLVGEAALAALSEGNRPLARRWLAEMRRDSASQRRGDRALYTLAVSWDALLAGDVRRAAGEHESALAAAEECGMPGHTCLAHLVASLALDGAGTPGAAVHLAVASGIAQQMNSAMLTFTVRLVEAHLAARRDEGRVIQTLAEVLRIGREHGYLNSWLWCPAAVADLATRALDTELEVDYVCKIVRQRRLEPPVPPVHLETWPWAIKLFTLGRFDVLVDDRPVRFPRKAQKKPLALLQALVALGGRDVREDELTESLWPDSDGDAAAQALSVTLHRLRKLLGHDGAVVRSDGHLGLAPSLCWVDVWAVEQTLARAEGAIARSPVRDHEWAASVRWTDRAVALYRGEFLGDPRSPWAGRVDGRLKEQLLRQLRRIGLLWEGIGDWEAAADCYKRAVTINEGAEDFYRRLMLAYLRLDRRADAVQTYQNCRRMLAALGVKPAAETEALARTFEQPIVPGTD